MKTIQHEFVEFIPEILNDDTLYISIEYHTAAHNCMCGCGNRVVTPITPKSWILSFNGKAVSLSPSIGNWSFKCESHYWIKNNEILWCRDKKSDTTKGAKKRKTKWRFW